MDGDTDLDLAVANRGANTVSILENNGDGTFAPKVDYPTGNGPYSVYAADLVGDSSLDLAVVNNVSSTISVFRNKGDGSFLPKYDFPTGLGPVAVHATDLDEDGDADLAIANDAAGSITILYNSSLTSPPDSCSAMHGDANASGTYTLGDIISTVNYIFNKPGCVPTPLCWLSSLLCRGDWNGSNSVTLGDVIQGVNYIFNKPGGPWNALPVGVCCLP